MNVSMEIHACAGRGEGREWFAMTRKRAAFTDAAGALSYSSD